MKSTFDAQKLAALIQAKRARSLRDTAEEIGLSTTTLTRLERGQITDIATLLAACDWLDQPLQAFILQEKAMTTPIHLADLTAQIRSKCQRDLWYGPHALRPNQKGRTWPVNGFWCPPATPEQIELTEEMLGFELPRSLIELYTTLANGGFGPGAGLRGMIGGYGTRYTAAPGERTFLNEESISKYQYEQLVPLTDYAWQQRGEDCVLQLPDDRWPQGLFPICDLGDCWEVCLDQDGSVFYWYPSSRKGFWEVKALSVSFERWLFEWTVGSQA